MLNISKNKKVITPYGEYDFTGFEEGVHILDGWWTLDGLIPFAPPLVINIIDNSDYEDHGNGD